ncbi:hypothetical protein GCM10027610_004260 [Dactylosporangium cerinum]
MREVPEVEPFAVFEPLVHGAGGVGVQGVADLGPQDDLRQAVPGQVQEVGATGRFLDRGEPRLVAQRVPPPVGDEFLEHVHGWGEPAIGGVAEAVDPHLAFEGAVEDQPCVELAAGAAQVHRPVPRPAVDVVEVVRVQMIRVLAHPLSRLLEVGRRAGPRPGQPERRGVEPPERVRLRLPREWRPVSGQGHQAGVDVAELQQVAAVVLRQPQPVSGLETFHRGLVQR